jgi:3'-phosphoadenosine 5'-phosphosulfate (PAPS) 3'-phosphatase
VGALAAVGATRTWIVSPNELSSRSFNRPVRAGDIVERSSLRSHHADETHYWVVDPNDDTAAMLEGFRGHAVSIAVVVDGRPVLGVVQVFAA